MAPEGTVALEGIASGIGVYPVVDPGIQAHLAGAEDPTGEAHEAAAHVALPVWAVRAVVAEDREVADREAAVAAVDDDFIRR